MLHNLKIKLSVYKSLLCAIFSYSKQLKELEETHEKLLTKQRKLCADLFEVQEVLKKTRLEKQLTSISNKRLSQETVNLKSLVNNLRSQNNRLLTSLDEQRKEKYESGIHGAN